MALPLALAGCGLDFPLLLASPAQGDIGTDEIFPFSATAENVEPEFKGFEIYYKIYLPPDEYLGERYFLSQFDLVQAGFRRLTSATDTYGAPQVPLLPVDNADKGKLYTVTVDFTNPENPTIYDTDPASTPDPIPEARRLIARVVIPTQYKPFYEWDSTDADIVPAILSDYIGNNLPVLVRLFVLSFGLDFTGALYSIPVWIGDGNILFEDLG